MEQKWGFREPKRGPKVWGWEAWGLGRSDLFAWRFASPKKSGDRQG